MDSSSFRTQPSLFMPPSDWVPHRGPLPDLRGSSPVAIDLETRDEGLAHERGPGWTTKWGHIAGVAAARGDMAWYFPLRHPDSENRPVDEVLSWVEDLLRSGTPIVGQNIMYDLGWLRAEGVEAFPETLHDTMVQSVMLDENQLSYSLDSICGRLGIPGKEKRLLEEAAAAHGCPDRKSTGSWIWRLPAKYVGEYAEADALQTLRASRIQLEQIKIAGLDEAYRLEMDILPTFIRMQERGIRISTDGAEQAQVALRTQLNEQLAEMSRRTNRRLSPDALNDTRLLEELFTAEQVPFTRTPKTQRGSFKSEWMKNADHWLPKGIYQMRQLDQMAEKFLGIYILEHVDRGRIHSEIHQLRDESNKGTRSYRLSYSNPPLQQMPARDPVLAPIIRAAFLAEEGEEWLSADYSQQEPRMAVHFATLLNLPGAADAEYYYNSQDNADFHNMVVEMTGLSRDQAKIINLALMYGMGIWKLAVSLGVSKEAAEAIMDTYNDRLPWVGGLSDMCKRRAEQTGRIKLIDGALCRFDLWEPSWRGEEESYVPPMPLEGARQQWPKARLKRAYTHKAMNRLAQGSAARQTKMAIRDCAREGLLPIIQMHDELCFSGDRPMGFQAARIMRDTVKLRIPVKVDLAVGPDWGAASRKGAEIPWS